MDVKRYPMKLITTLAKLFEPILPASLITELCLHTIKKRNNLINSSKTGKKSLLALNPGRFRGELEIIGENDQLTVIEMPFDWQCFLYSSYYGHLDDILQKKYLPQADSGATAEKSKNSKKYIKIISHILKKLQTSYSLHAVIAAGIHYRQDYEFIKVAKKLDIPAITLQRESNIASKGAVQSFINKAQTYKKFHGTHIFFHNHLQRDIFVENGYIDKERTIVTGIPRMDSLVKMANSIAKKEKIITLFSFGPSTGIISGSPPNWPHDPENYLFTFCADVHRVMYELAERYPDWNFIIKPKWGGQWPQNILDIINYPLPHPQNVFIRPDENTHNLIVKSSAIIGFNSTTLLEAALFNRNTILPIFGEAAEAIWSDYVMYKEVNGIFCSPESKTKLYDLIESIINSPPPSPLSMAEQKLRKQLFDRYAYASDGNATSRMLEGLNNIKTNHIHE